MIEFDCSRTNRRRLHKRDDIEGEHSEVQPPGRRLPRGGRQAADCPHQPELPEQGVRDQRPPN